MAGNCVFLASVPGLRTRDLDHMPRLRAMADAGACRELTPSFPCVTSPVQANMLTGKLPCQHGIIGNGFFHRQRGEVELWVGRNGLFESEQIWDRLSSCGISQAAWIPQNIKDAAADYIITPEPIHHPDGRTELWCYNKPEGLYADLHRDLGHFPLMNFWGPMANIKLTEWTINAALWLFQRRRPRFNYVYIPHLDYAAQKFGPDSEEQIAACGEADIQFGRLFDGIEHLGADDVSYILVSEYAMTDVCRVQYPNRLLRRAGLAQVAPRPDGEFLDITASRAFAVVDHQFAHVYVRDEKDIEPTIDVFRDVPGIARVLSGPDRADLALDHPRSGEVILVCAPDSWLAYYWWLEDAAAPPFARTVDIHQKPGYDPVEMFIDMPTRTTPLDAGLIKGSHGAPPESSSQLGACICSDGRLLAQSESLRDVDVFELIASALD